MITLRQDKGSELTFEEVDNNFKSFFYSASLNGSEIHLFTTGSVNPTVIDLNQVPGLGGIGVYGQDQFIALANNIRFTGSLLTITSVGPNEVQIEANTEAIYSGSVVSVNGKSGVVVISTDDISDLQNNNKFVNQSQKDKINFINVTSAVDLDQISNLAYSALQGGSDISLLNNDVGFLTEIYKEYSDINTLIQNRSLQNTQEVLYVEDASLDPSLNFSVGEVKKYGWYRYKGTNLGTIEDYILINAPYSIGGGGLQLGETSTTAYRGDRGKYSYDSIIEAEGFGYSDRLFDKVNF